MKNNYSSLSASNSGKGAYGSLTVPLNVTVIPATRELEQANAPLKMRMGGGLRVAAYCRVSTGDESQQTSYMNQVNYYTTLIRNRINWTFVDIYADEGLSGTSTARRVNFNRMLQDARDGKIDYIITKSISRFARNTVTTLSLVRELRSRKQPVGIYFEKERIDSLDPTGDLTLTIMSALAQEESVSISRNIRWSLQKRQKAGIPQINLTRMLGYDKGKNGEWLINEAQAKIVRDIYDRYLNCHSANCVAVGLNEVGIITLAGKKWTASAIIRILRNEKYAGDLLMQKTFTADILSHRPAVNRGQMPRFYIMDHHAPIIPRDAWNKVQILLDGKEWSLDDSDANIPTARKEGARGQNAHVFKNLTAFNGTDNQNGIPLRRCDYRYFVNLRGSDLGAGNGNCEQGSRYSYSVPMWVIGSKREPQPGRTVKEAQKRVDCVEETPDADIPHALCERALEQSFMEMLYAYRWDWLQNGENCLIEKLFGAARRELNRMSFDQKKADTELELIGEQISQILKDAESLNDRIKCIEFAGLNRLDSDVDRKECETLCQKRETYRQRLAALKARGEKLKRDVAKPQMYEANHRKFLKYLEKLPEVNAAGMPICINGLCIRKLENQGSTDTAEGEQVCDLLPFDKAAYSAFIRSGVAYGDTVEYETYFGVKLISVGNARSLADFIGFRRCQPGGKIEILDQLWKVNGHPLHRADARRNRKNTGESVHTTHSHTGG